MIMHCSCVSKQDALHGKGRRVHNATEKSGVYRCTQCSREHSESEARMLVHVDVPTAKSASAKKRRGAKQVRSLSKRH